MPDECELVWCMKCGSIVPSDREHSVIPMCHRCLPPVPPNSTREQAVLSRVRDIVFDDSISDKYAIEQLREVLNSSDGLTKRFDYSFPARTDEEQE